MGNTGSASAVATRDALGPHHVISFDPAVGEWLVLVFQRSVPGLPVWTVIGRNSSRSAAEQQAGLHAAKVHAWLVFHPEQGWLRAGSTGWSLLLQLAGTFGETQARLLREHDPSLELLVLRKDGRVTCADIEVAAA